MALINRTKRTVVLTALLTALLVVGPVVAASAATPLGAWPPHPEDSLKVTYIGNEGFLIESGADKVLIDALYRTGVAGYVVHEPETRRLLERALPPFDGVDVVLTTHFHADHFDPLSVGSHLVKNRSAVFISSPQVIDEIQMSFSGWRHVASRVQPSLPVESARDTLTVGDIRVVTLNLHHGRDRPIENLGFVIEIGGAKLLHIGDSAVTPDELRALGLADAGIDLFFVPYWFLAYDGWEGEFESTVGSPALIAMHIPPEDDPRGFLGELGGWVGMATRINEQFPNTVVPRTPLEVVWP